AKLTSKDERLHLHKFCHETPPEGAITIQYDSVLSHLPVHPPSLQFLDLTHENCLKGRFYIRLQPDLHAFIKHIPALFTANNEDSIMVNQGWNISGELFYIQIDKPVNDLSSRKKESVRINCGDIFCIFGGNSIQMMFIYFGAGNTYSSAHAKIGHIESGLEVAKACWEIGSRDDDKISMSDCGVVLEM
ncbi:unnamed protein product, partial [Meganyctiphanes norvegica]